MIRVEKVDKAIDTICEWIQKELAKNDYDENVIAMTNALAELVSARAKHN